MKKSKEYDIWEWEPADTKSGGTDAGLWRAADDNRLPSPKFEPKEEEDGVQD